MDSAERYSRQIMLPELGAEGQKRLSATKVLLLGVGGLGSPIATYLTAAGIGTLGIIDADKVSESNLQPDALLRVRGRNQQGRVRQKKAPRPERERKNRCLRLFFV